MRSSSAGGNAASTSPAAPRSGRTRKKLGARVGPLARGEVDRVIEQAGFVPTLALNYSTNNATFLRSFYQFALAPEDEARAIAAAAIAAGAETAVAFVPSTQRGYEIRDNFQAAFEQAGGQLLDWYGY